MRECLPVVFELAPEVLSKAGSKLGLAISIYRRGVPRVTSRARVGGLDSRFGY